MLLGPNLIVHNHLLLFTGSKTRLITISTPNKLIQAQVLWAKAFCLWLVSKICACMDRVTRNEKYVLPWWFITNTYESPVNSYWTSQKCMVYSIPSFAPSVWYWTVILFPLQIILQTVGLTWSIKVFWSVGGQLQWNGRGQVLLLTTEYKTSNVLSMVALGAPVSWHYSIKYIFNYTYRLDLQIVGLFTCFLNAQEWFTITECRHAVTGFITKYIAGTLPWHGEHKLESVAIHGHHSNENNTRTYHAHDQLTKL